MGQPLTWVERAAEAKEAEPKTADDLNCINDAYGFPRIYIVLQWQKKEEKKKGKLLKQQPFH